MDKKTKRVLIKTKRAVFSEIVGNNQSIFKGEGYDFVELREYQIGDDVKKIDWVISAKLQKPYIKLFHEERELNVVVISILNGSTYFGTKQLKIDSIAEIVATIGYSTIKNQDLFTSYTFADRLYETTKPSKRLFSVNKAVENIVNFNPIGKKLKKEDFLATFNKIIKRKSLVFIVSDFFENIDLRSLNRKHEVFAIIVRDRFEESPNELGFVNLIDPETNAYLEGNLSKGAIESYKKEIIKHDHILFQELKETNIKFTKIYTDEEPFIKLTRLFNKG